MLGSHPAAWGPNIMMPNSVTSESFKDDVSRHDLVSAQNHAEDMTAV